MSGRLADILAPDLRCVFVGINPGLKSAEAGFHFANPRNDFWRLLAGAGLTSRLLEPSQQDELLANGLGLTNAARRVTRGSGELRRTDFADAARRLGVVAHGLGARTQRIEKPEQIIPAINKAIAATREGYPVVLEFITKEEPDMAIG
jgi:hypothetical protein